MKVAGQEKRPDWQKLGPSIIIATALIVAIRTAKWSAKSSNANVSDVDIEMDQEVTFAARTSVRIMHELLKKHASLFLQTIHYTYEAGSEQDSPP